MGLAREEDDSIQFSVVGILIATNTDVYREKLSGRSNTLLSAH